MTALQQYTKKYNKPTLWAPSFFDDFFTEDVFKGYNPLVPYNVIQNYEGDQHISSIIEVALAGYDKKDINVKTVGDEIRITINKATETPNVHYVHRGISKRSASLKFKLAALYDKKNIKSSFRNGLLTVEIPVQEDGHSVINIED